MWITNSIQADWMCMLVNTGEGPVHKNKSLIMVPLREGPRGKLTREWKWRRSCARSA
jgi:citronellyl-CoA dehydrogenase